MSHAELSLRYEGAAVDSGVMDVRDLAPALLAVGNLIEATHRVVHGENTSAKVQVRAVGKGSFYIGFDVSVAFLQGVRDLMAGPDGTSAANIINILVGSGVVGGGALKLIKWLKGRRPSAIQRKAPGRVVVEIDGASIEVDEVVARVAIDVSVRLALSRVVAEPLSKDGIDSVTLGSTLDPERIEKADGYSFLELPDREAGAYEYRYRAPFSIVSLSFKSGNKWRLNDGRATLNVTVLDESYLQRIDNNEVSFAKSDILICDVRVDVREDSSGLKSEYFIERVLEHRPPSKQMSLFERGGVDPTSESET
ncbi:MAG: hypothetical protein KGQ37_05670 [Hyphomicrobiales bacterium]|nr:hypothetical protein [Hyphomicrobiales bacterium]